MKIEVGLVDRVIGMAEIVAGEARYSGDDPTAVKRLVESVLETVEGAGLTEADCVRRLPSLLSGFSWARVING